jgi:hypothetical protein
MNSPTLGSIEATAVPEIVNGERRFRGAYRVTIPGRDPIEGRTAATFADELGALGAAQLEGARVAAMRTKPSKPVS